MTKARYSGRTPAPDEVDELFQLVSITSTPAPSGSAGRDWLVYHIGQGANMITGYRRGDRSTVTAEVEKIVIALNERRGRYGSRDLRPNRRRAAAAVTPAEALPAGSIAAEGSAET